jgi:hypothetical protein
MGRSPWGKRQSRREPTTLAKELAGPMREAIHFARKAV